MSGRYGGVDAAVDITSGAVNVSKGSFLDKHGNIIGSILIGIWLIIAIIIIIRVRKNKNINSKDIKYYYIPSILLFLLSISDIAYYISAKKKKSAKANMIFANIALIPLYLVALVIIIFIATLSR
jgi:hypothetical protein